MKTLKAKIERRTLAIQALTTHIMAVKPNYADQTAYNQAEALVLACDMIDSQREFLRRRKDQKYAVVTSRLNPGKPLILIKGQHRSLLFGKAAL